MRRPAAALAAFALSAAALVAAAPSASAASLTVGAATVRETTISFTCTTDTPGRLVARSWRYVGFTPDSTHDDAAVVDAGGTVTQTRTLPDSEQGKVYAARCLLYDPASGALVVRAPASPQMIPVGWKVLFGSSNDQAAGETFAAAMSRRVAAFDPDIWRIFWPGLPSTNCADKRNAVNGKPTVQSFKDAPADIVSGADDALLNAWLACFTVPTRIAYYHEPEDNIRNGEYTAAAYVAAEDHVADLVAAHPNRANLISAQILMDWTLDAGSGRNWRTYYASHVDEQVWDAYDYPDCGGPTTFADHVKKRDWLAVAVETGKPWGIAELGENASDACRPDLLKQVVEFARANGARFVAYWDSNATGTDYRLSDPASQQVWRDAAA